MAFVVQGGRMRPGTTWDEESSLTLARVSNECFAEVPAWSAPVGVFPPSVGRGVVGGVGEYQATAICSQCVGV